MSTIAETQDTPKEGGFLSRLFNKITNVINDIKADYKNGMAKANQEIEYERQSEIQSEAQAWIQSGLSDAEALQKVTDFLANNKEVHQNGKIEASEILDMVQKIRTGEVTPRVEVQLNTLEA